MFVVGLIMIILSGWILGRAIITKNGFIGSIGYIIAVTGGVAIGISG